MSCVKWQKSKVVDAVVSNSMINIFQVWIQTGLYDLRCPCMESFVSRTHVRHCGILNRPL